MRALAAALLLAAFLPLPSAHAAPAAVSVSSFQFSPSAVTIQAGESVTWSWNGGFHSVTFDAPSAPADCPAQSSGTCTRTFPAAGTYAYHCAIHPSMTGSVTVLGPASDGAPTASFSLAQRGYFVDVDGSASADPEGQPLGYDWEWGDGSASVGPTKATHEYAQPGNYTVALFVTDPAGHAANATRLVAVPSADGDKPPIAAFEIAIDDRFVEVNASATRDPEDRLDNVTLAWGDGASSGGPFVLANHTYAADGNYTITLVAVDKLGQRAEAAQRIHVEIPPPLDAGFAVESDGQRILVKPNLTSAGVGHAWDFGDGQSVTSGGATDHGYGKPGSYLVTHTVTLGKRASVASMTVTVAPKAATSSTPPPAASSTPEEKPGVPGFELWAVAAAILILTMARGRSGRS